MSNIERLKAIMAQLRDPESGCPWDCKQTMKTIIPHTIEEVYEVIDAIEHNDMVSLQGELGDLLLQVIFYSQIAQEQGLFGFDEVVQTICDKLIHRHPHVFGDVVVESVEDQNRLWESIKEQERSKDVATSQSALDGVIRSLPALMRAHKLQKRAARVGFDWPTIDGALMKVDEELEEVREAINQQSNIAEEVGDLLFAVVNVSRQLGIDPEIALRSANEKFEVRFKSMEQRVGGKEPFAELSLDAMEHLWQEVKKGS